MRIVLTQAQILEILARGEIVVYKGRQLKEATDVPNDAQILVDVPEYAYTKIEGNAKGILGYLIDDVPANGEVLQFDGVNKKFIFAAGGGGGGTGTVNSGAAKRLAYYSATGTTVDDAAGFEYQAAASPNILITSQNNAYVALRIQPAGNSYTVAPFEVTGNSNGASFLFDPIAFNDSRSFANLTVLGAASEPFPGIAVATPLSGSSGTDGAYLSATVNSSAGISLEARGPGYSNSNFFTLSASGKLYTDTNTSAGLVLLTSHASAPIRFATGGFDFTNERLRILESGQIQLYPIGTSAGNTNELRFLELAANGMNYVGIKAPDALAGNVVWTLPSADGSSGQVLSTNGSGILSWSTISSGLTVGTTAIASGAAGRLLYETSGNALGELTTLTSDGTIITFSPTVTTGTGATSGLNANANSLTTGDAFNFASSSVSSGNVMKIAATGTAAAGNTKTALNVSTSGANGTATQTTYGARFDNTSTGTSSTNIALNLTASGGTNNYAIYVSAGQILAPSGSTSAASYGFTSSVNSGFYYNGGNVEIIEGGRRSLVVQANGAGLYLGGAANPSILFGSAINVTLRSNGAGNLAFGAADAASPVAQTLSVQNVAAGTTNAAGADWARNASIGTGTGAGGKHIWRVAGAGSSGTAQNSLATVLQLTPAASATTGLEITSNAAGSGVTITALSSGTNEDIYLLAKGTGITRIGSDNLYLNQSNSGSNFSSIFHQIAGSTYFLVGGNSSGVALNPAVRFGTGGNYPTGLAAASGVLRVTNGSTGSGSLIIGPSTASIGTSGVGVLAFSNGTAPTTSPADEIQLYAADFAAGDSRLYIRTENDSAGSPIASLGKAQSFTAQQTFAAGYKVTGSGMNAYSVASGTAADSTDSIEIKQLNSSQYTTLGLYPYNDNSNNGTFMVIRKTLTTTNRRIMFGWDIDSIGALLCENEVFQLRFGGYPGTAAITMETTAGMLGIGGKTTSIGAYLHVLPRWADKIGLIVDTAASPTADVAQFKVNGTDAFVINKDGVVKVPATYTAGGTTGAQTINKVSGTVNFAAAATSLVVTNSLVTTSSMVFCVIQTDDTTATIKNVVPAAGSFTINLNAAATAETKVAFWVINN